MYINCYRVVGESFVEGVPLYTEFPGRDALPIDCSEVSICCETVMYAEVQEEGKSLVAKPPQIPLWNNQYWVLYIPCGWLKFSEGSFAKGLSLPLGGSFLKRKPLWESGTKVEHYDHAHHSQVWVLRDYENLIVCDQYGGLRVVSSVRGKLTMSRLSAYYLMHYLHLCGQKCIDAPTAENILHNMQCIQKQFPQFCFKSFLEVAQRCVEQHESVA